MEDFMMKKWALVSAILIAMALVLGFSQTGRAQVSVSFNVESTGLMVIPGTYVYYYTENNNDLYFYGGYWWRPWHNGWQRSGRYSGPWNDFRQNQVPMQLTRLPNRWKENIRMSERIPYSDVNNHWREWERTKYWDKQNWKRADNKAAQKDRMMDNRKDNNDKNQKNKQVNDNNTKDKDQKIDNRKDNNDKDQKDKQKNDKNDNKDKDQKKKN
jgi:hypothetical protein